MRRSEDKDEENDNGMTRGEILASIRVLLVAGSETSASVLSGTMYFLLKNPLWLIRVQNEVRKVFSMGDEITLGALTPGGNGKVPLPLLEAVLKESFRRYPPVPTALPRVTPPGGAIIDGKFVPGDVSVGVHQWSTYHSPDNFESPDIWDPARWLDDHAESEQYRNDDNSSLQPFSLGPRGCVGKR